MTMAHMVLKPKLAWNEGAAYDAWRAEHGAAAFTLHETEERMT